MRDKRTPNDVCGEASRGSVQYQNVVKTSVSHSPADCVALHCFSPHFEVICDLLLNRPTATWNPFVNLIVLIVSRAESKEY